MHGRNRTHSSKECFELKQSMSCDKANKVSYKDLNVFANAKVTAALNKAKKSQKKKEQKK
eukprot:6458307-Ditylum_brightwellii.AAC.1